MTKSLSKAIALATALGAAASAHAVNVNQDGLGEVLLYSLYTSEQGNITNVHITNTTPVAKAVKVRFVEGQNSREVLDFNLYLSPYDQWSGAVTQTDEGAKLITADKSCTAPAIPADGIEFRNYAYATTQPILDLFGSPVLDSAGNPTFTTTDGGEQSTARTRVGHIEVIEMGVLDSTLAGLVTADHNKPGQAPAGCNTLVNKFKTIADAWSPANASYNTGFEPDASDVLVDGISTNVTGGLYGYATILNIENSTQIAYDAVAIDNFLTDGIVVEPKHTSTGSTLPNLNTGGNNFAVFKNGDSIEFANSASAVSAVLMKESISNDFVLDEARESKTNWVITFPTKRFHVDTSAVGNEKPFVNRWAAGKSCHQISYKKWDNEEYAPVAAGPELDIDFSPMPPVIPGVVTYPQLCFETNILTFNEAKVLGGEFVSYDVNLRQPDYQFGWLKMSFDGHQTSPTVYTPYSLEGINTSVPVADRTVNGLPVIGFSAVTISNNEANGVMNNYGSSTNHKANTTKDH